MAQGKYKYMDVDIVSFLEEKMKNHVEHYQCDFDVDKKIIHKAAQSVHKEDKTLLWMARPMGTHCHKEHDVFIRDTAAYNTWRYYAEQSSEPIIAYAAEITGTVNGVIRGNVYELDYLSHVAETKKNAVEPLVVVKTFKDGFVESVPVERSSYPYYVSLVQEHGAIIDSITFPQNKEQHAYVLAHQKNLRRDMKPMALTPSQAKPSLTAQIRAAAVQSGKTGPEGKSPEKSAEYVRR